MKNKPMWMVRAQVGGRLFDQFKSQSLVAIGWQSMGDMNALKTREDFSNAVLNAYPDNRRGQTIVSASQAYRFVREFNVGDRVITYDPSERVYLVGTIIGEYEYAQN